MNFEAENDVTKDELLTYRIKQLKVKEPLNLKNWHQMELSAFILFQSFRVQCEQ